MEYHLITNGTQKNTTILLKNKNNVGQLYIDLKARGWKFLLNNVKYYIYNNE